MMTQFKRLVWSAKCVVLSALAATALGSTTFGDTVLTQDEDWRGQEAEKLTGVIDLNGHNLTVSALTGNATIIDTTEDYKLLDSITSTGTQFVNTGYKPNDKTVVEAKFNVKTPTTGWGEFFACTSDDGCKSNKYPPPTGFGAGWDIYRCRWNNDKTASKIGGFVGGKSGSVNVTGNTVVTVKLENGKFTVNGTTSTFAASPTYTGTLDLYIFGCNCPCPWGSGDANRAKNTAANDLYRAQAMTLYSFKITENGVVQRDFLPARRMSDNMVGLLDRQNGVFYPNNASSGADFTAGAETNVLHVGTNADLTVPGGAIELTLRNGSTLHSASGTKDKLIDNKATAKSGGGEVDNSRILIQDFAGCSIDYDFGEGNAKIVRGLWLRTGNYGNGSSSPKTVVVYGAQKAPSAAAEGAFCAP